jgi:hypothetical protein
MTWRGDLPGGGIVFSAFHGTSEPFVTTEDDFDDPVVALVDIEGREVRELFEPGVVSTTRMFPDGFRAVALADTCSGDCSGAEAWTLDLSRYLDEIIFGSGCGGPLEKSGDPIACRVRSVYPPGSGVGRLYREVG